MAMRTERQPLAGLCLAAALLAGASSTAALANEPVEVVCATTAAQSVIESRDNARARQGAVLQEAIDTSTGGVEPDIISDNCLTDIFERGIGGSISLPTIGDVIGAIGERIYDAFCRVVDESVREVNRDIDEATRPVQDVPGVDGDAGVGRRNPEDGTEVGVGQEDVTDDVADGVEDAVIDGITDDVLDGLY